MTDVKKNEDVVDEIPLVYTGVDMKFISKYKKLVSDYIELLAGEYLNLIRPTNDKPVAHRCTCKVPDHVYLLHVYQCRHDYN